MANTFTQLYIQFVFAPKYRAALLHPQWDEQLRKYITGTTQKNGHKMFAINNMPDHIHLLIGLNPTQSISDLMRIVKGESSEWINKANLTDKKFHWQEGYGAFSYGKSQIDAVVKYIINQQEHHKTTAFLEEYIKLLNIFGVEYDPRNIFKLPED